MKKLLIGAIIIALCVVTTIIVHAENYKTVNVIVNDSEIEAEGIIKDNRTLVPVRGIFEELKYEVEWKPNIKAAFFTGNDYDIEIQAGQNSFGCFNNAENTSERIYPDVPQQIINGHFYIPLRAVSEAIGADVKWDQTTYTAFINKDLRKKINIDDFKSDYIKNYLEDENIVYINEIASIFKLTIPTEEFKPEVLEDVMNFPMVNWVEFEGDPIEDYTLLKEFFNINDECDINFLFPGEDDYVDASNIDEFIDYYNIRKRIINNIIDKNDSDFDKVLAIHDYMVLNTDYDNDNFERNTIPEEDYDPYYVLKRRTGVCEGYAKATMALLNMVGIENEYISGTAGDMYGWGGHAWVIVKLNNNYYHLDVTFDDPVEMPSDFIQWDYFLKSDMAMSADHKWDKSEHPKCATDYGYEAPYDYYELHSDRYDNHYDYYYDDYYYKDSDYTSENNYDNNNQNYTDDNSNSDNDNVNSNTENTDVSNTDTEDNADNDTINENTDYVEENTDNTTDNSDEITDNSDVMESENI